jgi:hypothetical protein
MRYSYSQKLWNSISTFPYFLFKWVRLGGTYDSRSESVALALDTLWSWLILGRSS